nr:hypothetical transcript [Hymenolepis microstoma]
MGAVVICLAARSYEFNDNSLSILYVLSGNAPPKFPQSSITINSGVTKVSSLVATVQAQDNDIVPNGPNNEDCQLIDYEVSYSGHEHHLFEITQNGELYFRSMDDLITWMYLGTTTLNVTARNRGKFSNSFNSVAVRVTSTASYESLIPTSPYNMEMSRLYPKTSAIQPNAIQVIHLAMAIDNGADLSAEITIYSEDLYETFQIEGAKIYRLVGATLAPGSKLILEHKPQNLSSDVTLSVVGNIGNLKGYLDYQLPVNPALPNKVTLPSQPGLYLESSNDGLVKLVYEVEPLVGYFEDLVLTCLLTDAQNGMPLAKVMQLSQWNNENIAFPNVYSTNKACHLDELSLGTLYLPSETNAKSKLQVDIYLMLFGSGPVTANVICQLNDLNAPILRTQVKNLQVTSNWAAPTPYDLSIKMKCPITGREINRPLQSGEYVLVTFSFTLPAKSISDYKADIFLDSNQYVTLCCPHIVSVGSDLIWRPSGCFAKNSSDHPVHQITYDLGNIISIANNTNEVGKSQ